MGTRLSSIATPVMWVAFVALIVALLALSLLRNGIAGLVD